MELDLQSFFGLHVRAQLYSLAEALQFSTLPPHLGSYTRALLVSQDRRHLIVTPEGEGGLEEGHDQLSQCSFFLN